jgi:hypothetical protein
MIRIDEIYNNTFWPWFAEHCPGTRVFFCDPFGHTDSEHLFNLGSDSIIENDYVYMHDQEPVHLDLHESLFNEVKLRNLDIGWHSEGDQWVQQSANPKGHVIVSERGEYVDALEQKYGWTTHYYFFHGWAAQDWFRGYDKTFLIARARDRQPTKTFMSPNRIVAGKRDHRVLFLYNVFKHGLEDNHISAPRTCQYEGVDISTIASKYINIYPDICQTLDQADLPRLFKDEPEQLMSSCTLTNFKEAEDSLIYVATETVYFGRRTHITEKTFKAIALEMPFVLVAPAHSLAYLREYGFRTFAPYIDESYDLIEDPIGRIEAVTLILSEIQARSAAARQQLWTDLLPRVEHNYRHFYRGGFSDRLWQELTDMLAEFKPNV